MGYHETVELLTLDGDRVSIDVGIADLIQRLWSVEVHTTSSCQGGPLSDDRAFVVLPRDTDLGIAFEQLPPRTQIRVHYPENPACHYIAEWRV